MALEVITFTLNSLETGRRLGGAVVCPGGGYASVWWQGTPRPARRHAALATWREIEGELSVGLPPGPSIRPTIAAGLVGCGGCGG
jgi:hypothetical protein